ncbi:BlaI/MecI/CopY family transcriptional regulator [Fusibacillus kribbianus]|uniref:BlaI/MecI/CopY family transcriptional regulator n=1 Tax=Fusibacillus kribbianus TaxID=3044208 RepID=A0AAP4BBN7_9FIRM|nr:BlaI/MecI/CopY family transcriptional regulator [Ruminococcus sp. YH-rum2234]MDI9243005.1 BlaI/MecI/CopY family transcriptional regulator [Ruminococcus sp. YH-rum2234]
MKMQELPPTELTVMKAIWDAGKPVHLSEIHVMLERYGKDWQYQTVSTYIRSLVRRGFLIMEQVKGTRGKVYLYTPAISQEEYLEYTMGKMARFWGKHSLKPILCALRENEELTEEDIQELQGYLHDCNNR